MDNQKHIELSIIIPTIGRKKELDKLLLSIINNTIDFSYEVLIIDQNPKGFIDEIVKNHENNLQP